MAEKNKKHLKDNVTVESYKNKIVTYLSTGKRLIPLNELETKCRTKKSGRDNFVQAFGELRTEGIVTVRIISVNGQINIAFCIYKSL